MVEERTTMWRRALAMLLCLSQATCTPVPGLLDGDGGGEPDTAETADAPAPAVESTSQALGACLDPICFDSSDTLLNTTVQNAQDMVASAAGPSGAVLMVYRDRSQSTLDATDTGDVRVRLFDANGVPRFDDRLASVNSLKIQTTPVVAANATGFVVAWSDNVATLPDNAGYSIRARRFDLSGAAVDAAEFVVNTGITLDQTQPAVTTLSNGDYLFVWKDGSKRLPDNLLGAIRARRLRVNGTMGAELLVNSTYKNDQLEPWVAPLPNGGWVSTWTCGSLLDGDADGTQVRGRVFNGNDVALGNDFRVNTATARDQRQSRVASAPDGSFLVVFTHYGVLGALEDYEIRGQRFSAAGARLGGELAINTTIPLAQSLPAVAAMPGDSQYLVVWQDASKAAPDSNGTGIRGRLVAFDGTLVGQDQVLTATTVGNQTAPHVSSPGGTGPALITWTDASLASPDAAVSGIRGRWLRMSACGDGRVSADAGEECDDGNRVSGDGCSAACDTERCGDGVLQAGRGEQCDDGANNTLQNNCLPTCQLARCGDGVTQLGRGEQCDDGNGASGDGCTPNCTREVPTGYACSELCGNGVVEAGEACDRGGGTAGAARAARFCARRATWASGTTWAAWTRAAAMAASRRRAASSVTTATTRRGTPATRSVASRPAATASWMPARSATRASGRGWTSRPVTVCSARRRAWRGTRAAFCPG